MLNHYLDSIDLESYTKKTFDYLEENKDAALGVWRYTHKGLILPDEIEHGTKVARRHLPNLKQGESQTYEGVKLKLLTTHGNHYQVVFKDSIHNVAETILITLFQDKARGKDLSTQVSRGQKKYRSVREDGNVYNHTHTQQPFYENIYVPSLVRQGVLTPDQGSMLLAYHPSHDIFELKGGDAYFGDKDGDSGEIEHQGVMKQLRASAVNFEEKEIKFAGELSRVLENKHGIFKPGERLGYIKNGIQSYEHPQRYHTGKLFAVDVLYNQFETLADFNSNVTIPSAVMDSGKEQRVNLRNMAVIKEFLGNNTSAIENTLEDIELQYEDGFSDEQKRIFNRPRNYTGPLSDITTKREKIDNILGYWEAIQTIYGV